MKRIVTLVIAVLAIAVSAHAGDTFINSWGLFSQDNTGTTVSDLYLKGGLNVSEVRIFSDIRLDNESGYNKNAFGVGVEKTFSYKTNSLSWNEASIGVKAEKNFNTNEEKVLCYISFGFGAKMMEDLFFINSWGLFSQDNTGTTVSDLYLKGGLNVSEVRIFSDIRLDNESGYNKNAFGVGVEKTFSYKTNSLSWNEASIGVKAEKNFNTNEEKVLCYISFGFG